TLLSTLVHAFLARMTRRGLIAVCILSSGLLSAFAQTNGAPLDFQDVYNLIRQHAAGVSEAELNRAAVKGLISELSPQVTLVTNENSGHADSDAAPITQRKLFDGDIAYLRVAHVNPGLAEAVTAAYQQLTSSNKAGGVVLDLRYTDGTDYPAAASTADLFVSKSE